MLVIAFAAIALWIGGANRSGRYEPARSLAGEMTDEWRDFAAQVDRICARNFNAMQVELAALNASAEFPPPPPVQAEAALIQADYQRNSHDQIAALGQPPAEPELFASWLANVERRAEMMEEVAIASGEQDRDRQLRVLTQIAAEKVNANWLGQRFGLRICTSNGPGREPGDSEESYLERVNRICLQRNAIEDKLASRQELGPVTILSLSRRETLEIAAIGPADDQYELRAEILAAKRGLDRSAQAMVRKARRAPNFERVWDGPGGLAVRVSRRAGRAQGTLQALGLLDCGNWGPTPAPTLLPGS